MGTEYDADQNSSPPAYTETITVIDDQIRRVDRESGRVGVSRVLTMAATGTVPVKGWRVQVRGSWHRIAEVVAVAPGGTDLLFDLVLEG